MVCIFFCLVGICTLCTQVKTYMLKEAHSQTRVYNVVYTDDWVRMNIGLLFTTENEKKLKRILSLKSEVQFANFANMCEKFVRNVSSKRVFEDVKKRKTKRFKRFTWALFSVLFSVFSKCFISNEMRFGVISKVSQVHSHSFNHSTHTWI